MTSDFQLVYVTDLEFPRPKMLADTKISTMPYDWAVIPPEFTVNKQPVAFLAVDNTVFLVDQLQSQDQVIPGGPFKKMTISPNGGLIALFSSIGKILVISSDFQRNLSDFDTNSPEVPSSFDWCGADSVVMFRDRTLLIVGPFGDTAQYSYLSDEICLIPEIDGIKILSQNRCEFLQKVPGKFYSWFYEQMLLRIFLVLHPLPQLLYYMRRFNFLRKMILKLKSISET